MRVRIVTGLFASLLASAASGWAQTMPLESAGLRAGFSATSISDGYCQLEAFGCWYLPWRWELGTNWLLQTRLDLSAGWLTGQGDEGVIGSVGPEFVLRRVRLPLLLDLGISPTLMSRDKFGVDDFGIPFQLTFHAGFNWELSSHFRLGYRFQHMSNAGLDPENNGLDLHMLLIGYRF